MSNNVTTPPLPSIFVGKDVINRRVTLFMQQKHGLLSQVMSQNGTQRQETKCIWYSKEHVETWLNEMSLMNADGMRVYFGTYAEEDGQAAGQLCLLMVLTRSENNGSIHRDIILENEINFSERSQQGRTRTISTGDNGNGKPREYNYGAPCPPSCPDGPAFPE
jgi:hypothetical protein